MSHSWPWSYVKHHGGRDKSPDRLEPTEKQHSSPDSPTFPNATRRVIELADAFNIEVRRLIDEYITHEYVAYHFLKDIIKLREACQMRAAYQAARHSSGLLNSPNQLPSWSNYLVGETFDEEQYKQAVNRFADDYSREKQINLFVHYNPMLDRVISCMPDMYVAAPETNRSNVILLQDCDLSSLSRDGYAVQRESGVLQCDELDHNGYTGSQVTDYLKTRTSILQGAIRNSVSYMATVKISANQDLGRDEWRLTDHTTLRNSAHEHYTNLFPRPKYWFKENYHAEEYAKMCCNMRGDLVREILNDIINFKPIKSV